MGYLIFFTSQFPYGRSETFIENELPFLANAFERIIIVSNDIDSTTLRSVPTNVKVIRASNSVPFNYKIKALIGFFNPVIQSETVFIKNRLKLSLSTPVLSAMLGGYAQALHISDLVEEIIVDNQLPRQSVVLYSYWMSNMATGLAIYKQKNPGVKAVCRAHGWDVYFERHHPPYLPFRNFIAGKLDYCCCISQSGKNYFENILTGHVKNNIRVSRLGTFNKMGKRSGYNRDKLVIVSCSNIIPLKRVHLIIETLALIKDTNIEWIHFGSGSLEEKIKIAAKEKLGQLANIRYCFAGQISNPELLEYYAANNIDLFINLSETEGLPVSFMEAGSFGIPVIGTNVGGVSEIIKQDINGFLLDASAEPNYVVEKIRAYYNMSVSGKEKMRDNAFSEWQKNYNAEKNYPEFIDLLKGTPVN